MDKTSLIDSALAWNARGIPVIPVKTFSKAPLIRWKRWQGVVQPTDLIEVWFRRFFPCNLGIIVGNGLNVIDFDDWLSYANWVSEMPHLAETLTVTTRRGRHVYLWVEQALNTTVAFEGGEIKGNGIVIVPPSIHNKGHRYEYVNKDARILGRAGVEDFGVRILGKSVDSLIEWCSSPPKYNDTGLVRKIKEDINIASYLSRYTDLIKQQDGTYLARCVFHDDKSPSLYVYPETGKCFCFAPHCQGHIGMDIINVVSKLHGISIRDAIMLLASEL